MRVGERWKQASSGLFFWKVKCGLSAFWRGALGIERKWAELLRPSHRAGPGQDPHNRRGRIPSDGSLSSSQEDLGGKTTGRGQKLQPHRLPSLLPSFPPSLPTAKEVTPSMEWLRSPAGAGPCRLKCQSVTEEERRPRPSLPPESLALCSPRPGPFGKQLQSAPPLSFGASLSERGDGLSPSPGTIADRRPLHRAPADLGFL